MHKEDKRRPLLSIIVPTKDRHVYAIHCIKSLLSLRAPEVEIVVIDNGKGDELFQWIKNISDVRLVYHRVKGWTSVIDNFETGIRISSGLYICSIGDDDGVNPEIVEATKWAYKEKLDALIPSISADYSWPDLRIKYYGSGRAGLLRWNNTFSKPIRPEIHEELERCMLSGGQKFGLMPKVYYGIVLKKCVDVICSQAGKFLLGVSPDMSASVSLCCSVKEAVFVDYPLFIPGSSAKSTAGTSGMKQHHGSLSEQAHLPLNCQTGWPGEVPAFFAVQTVWAQSAVATLKALGKENYLNMFAIAKLHALCIVFNPNYMRQSFQNYFRIMDEKKKFIVVSSTQLMIALFIVLFKRSFGLLKRVLFKTKEFDNECSGFNDINMASIELTQQLNNAGISWKTYIND